MMEEANEEQPEIVTHEEVALAEKEAKQTLATAGVEETFSAVAAPLPLPSFMTEPPLSATVLQSTTPLISTSLRQSESPTKSLGSVPLLPRVPLTRSQAPVPMQTPFEASSAIPVTLASTSSDHPPTSPSVSQGGGLFGWFSNSNLVSKMVEKTKSSMESVITTLDPGMRDVIRSGGEIEIVVTSTKDSKLLAVRQAFQETFGRATVTGRESQATTAAQPVGFTAGLKSAEDRISTLQRSGEITEGTPFVSVEGFIVELFPDKWYEMSCLILRDAVHGIELQTCSQPTFIPSKYVMAAQDQTPPDYPLRWSGLAVTIGQVIEKDQPHIGRVDWQKVISGVSRRDSLYMAALSLAHIYRQQLPTSFVS